MSIDWGFLLMLLVVAIGMNAIFGLARAVQKSRYAAPTARILTAMQHENEVGR